MATDANLKFCFTPASFYRSPLLQPTSLDYYKPMILQVLLPIFPPFDVSNVKQPTKLA